MINNVPTPNRLFENAYDFFPQERDSKNYEMGYSKSFCKYLQSFSEKKLVNSNNK